MLANRRSQLPEQPWGKEESRNSDILNPRYGGTSPRVGGGQ